MKLETYVLTPAAALTCAFGTPWLEHWLGPLFTCAACDAETARLEAEHATHSAMGAAAGRVPRKLQQRAG